MNDTALAAVLFAVDPVGSGGVALRAAYGPTRDAWLAELRGLLPAQTPWRRLPLHIHDERLLGGLDLGATLQAGRPVARRGVLAEADGGVLLLAMAERLPAGTAARLAAAIDVGRVQVERDGIGLQLAARFGVVALDEGVGDDEGLPAALLDRLAFHLRLDESSAAARGTDGPVGFGAAVAAPESGDAVPAAAAAPRALPRSADAAGGASDSGAAAAAAGATSSSCPPGTTCAADSGAAAVAARVASDVGAARQRLPAVTASEDIVQALCAAALALGVASLRAPLLALRVARAAAALAGRAAVRPEDAALAARLVLAPRATQLPAADAPPRPADGQAEDRPAAAAATPRSPSTEDGPQGYDVDRPPPHESPKPSDEPSAEEGEPMAANPSSSRPAPTPQRRPGADPAIDDAVLEAAVSAIPAGLLAGLALGQAMRSSAKTAGRAGALQAGRLRGRPAGAQRGEPKGGGRLDLLATLRAAAPWQAMRRRQLAATAPTPWFAAPTSPTYAESPEMATLPLRTDDSLRQVIDLTLPIPAAPRSPAALPPSKPVGPAPSTAATPLPPSARSRPAVASPAAASPPSTPNRLLICRDDFRITRFQQRSVTTTLFVVDASGSAALHRLAEAKGAVELLLADCYVRRDNVALLAFRGRAAELLLPPTRSLVRAKRSLAGLPGGGGTPLAAGIDAAGALADAVRRRGETPIVVLLTDGRANIARDGTPGRAAAGADALAAARQFRAAGYAALLLDTSAQPQAPSAALAREMGAVYLPLPYAGAVGLSQAVLAVQSARHVAAAGGAVAGRAA